MTEKELNNIVGKINESKGMDRDLLETKLTTFTLWKLRLEPFFMILYLIVGASINDYFNSRSESREKKLIQEIRRELHTTQGELRLLHKNFQMLHYHKDTTTTVIEKPKSLQEKSTP